MLGLVTWCFWLKWKERRWNGWLLRTRGNCRGELWSGYDGFEETGFVLSILLSSQQQSEVKSFAKVQTCGKNEQRHKCKQMSSWTTTEFCSRCQYFVSWMKNILLYGDLALPNKRVIKCWSSIVFPSAELYMVLCSWCFIFLIKNGDNMFTSSCWI